jgi:hypothetical protein
MKEAAEISLPFLFVITDIRIGEDIPSTRMGRSNE